MDKLKLNNEYDVSFMSEDNVDAVLQGLKIVSSYQEDDFECLILSRHNGPSRPSDQAAVSAEERGQTTENSFYDEDDDDHDYGDEDGQKPFKCNLCTHKYGSKSTLKRHLKEHDDTRPFTCIKCNKSFKRNYQLTQHICKQSNATRN